MAQTAKHRIASPPEWWTPAFRDAQVLSPNRCNSLRYVLAVNVGVVLVGHGAAGRLDLLRL